MITALPILSTDQLINIQKSHDLGIVNIAISLIEPANQSPYKNHKYEQGIANKR